jgi:hypothetical protein
MKFQATVLLGGKTATGIEVPDDVLAALGGGKRPRIKVTINGYTYRSTVGSMGGRSLVPVSAEVRSRSGVQAGDQVEVEIVADTEARTVDVPADLADTLRRHPEAQRAWERLSYSAQHRHVLAIEQAKTAETRSRRVQRVIEELGRPA